MEKNGRNTGYTTTVCGATPALLKQLDQVCSTRPHHEGLGLIAQRCKQASKQARLSLEATQAVNRHDSGTP